MLVALLVYPDCFWETFVCQTESGNKSGTWISPASITVLLSRIVEVLPAVLAFVLLLVAVSMTHAQVPHSEVCGFSVRINQPCSDWNRFEMLWTAGREHHTHLCPLTSPQLSCDVPDASLDVTTGQQC